MSTQSDPHRLPTPATATDPVSDDDFGFTAPNYDASEYRWVPVRRRPRDDGWTEERQRRFIEVLADTGLVGLAAREVGMTWASAYRLRRAAHAGAFARASDRAREIAGALIEDIAFERAIGGVEVETWDGNGEELTGEEIEDWCAWLDPAEAAQRSPSGGGIARSRDAG